MPLEISGFVHKSPTDHGKEAEMKRGKVEKKKKIPASFEGGRNRCPHSSVMKLTRCESPMTVPSGTLWIQRL